MHCLWREAWETSHLGVSKAEAIRKTVKNSPEKELYTFTLGFFGVDRKSNSLKWECSI